MSNPLNAGFSECMHNLLVQPWDLIKQSITYCHLIRCLCVSVNRQCPNQQFEHLQYMISATNASPRL